MADFEEREKDVVYFGKTDFRNTNRLFGIKRKDRRQHLYVIGKTGTGKSAMLNNLIVQDIANGEGLCVVDPHGELVEGILEKIPEERVKDVIYFNPADPDFHIGFNVLELPDPKYKHLAASGLMSIFTKIWSGVWSARMEYILNNSILALLDTPGSTLLGVTRLLVDKDYRQKIIANIKDPVVKAFWLNEYEEWKDQFRNEAIAPIQNKVGQFLSTAMVRNIVGQSKSTIDIFDIMNSGKIFLVNVAKGRIGEDNSALLGAMLITKIQLAAMERVRVPEDERVDFYLYVDEFQNFATDSFANILSEARKYRLNLILAHQYIGQLVTDVSTKVRDAVFGNVGTMVTFRVGATDAEFLEKEYEPEFLGQDMVNLPNYHIYLKLMVDGVTSRPFSAVTLPPFKVVSSEKTVSEIIEFSRKTYARPRFAVEEEINSWAGMSDGGSSGGGGGFPIVCSACGKETTVPFEPQPGRPVYCRDCLAKIKAGELKPVRVAPGAVPEKVVREARGGELAGLGIEFESSPQTPMAKSEARPAPHPAPNTAPSATHKPFQKHFLRSRPARDPMPTYEEERTSPAKSGAVSLSALAPQSESKNLKREPEEGESIEELRNSLKDALSHLNQE
jgi:CxxC-x17-CxxC domain-containing protein